MEHSPTNLRYRVRLLADAAFDSKSASGCHVYTEEEIVAAMSQAVGHCRFSTCTDQPGDHSSLLEACSTARRDLQMWIYCG
jgi:uncharacterized protein (DUF2344 family)